MLDLVIDKPNLYKKPMKTLDPHYILQNNPGLYWLPENEMDQVIERMQEGQIKYWRNRDKKRFSVVNRSEL